MTSVTRQLQRQRPAAFAQHRLVEHPAVQVGAETVQQQHWYGVAASHFQTAENPIPHLDLAWRQCSGIVRRHVLLFDHHKPRDERIDLCR